MGMSSGHTSCKARKWLDKQKESNKVNKAATNAAQTASPSQEVAAGSEARHWEMMQMFHHFYGNSGWKKLFFVTNSSVFCQIDRGATLRKSQWKQAQITNMQRFKATMKDTSPWRQVQSSTVHWALTRLLRVGKTKPRMVTAEYQLAFIHALKGRPERGASPPPCPPTREHLGSSSRRWRHTATARRPHAGNTTWRCCETWQEEMDDVMFGCKL